MLSPQKLSVFLQIQQSAIDTEDSLIVLDNLLKKTIQTSPLIGLNLTFISVLILDLDGKIRKDFFVDQKNTNHPLVSASMILNTPVMLDPQGQLIKDLASGKVVKTENVNILVSPLHYDVTSTKSLSVVPLLTAGKITGIMVLGLGLPMSQVDQDTVLFLEMVGNLVNINFRLQDTQTSLTDITQQLYKMNAQLHQLDKVKDDFVSIASHELRTPMTAIRSYVWMALNRPDMPLTDKLKRYLDRTLISTERLINLVNDMLNISRIESGRISITPTVLDMKALVSDVIAEVETKAKEKNLLVSMIDSQVPKVFADPDKVHQVLLNLVGNAMKFTPNSGSIAISFFSDGITLETSVKDNGAGITPEDMAKLFKKFGKLDNSYVAAAASGGTGLGLFISKSLIDLMHGKIWARSDGQNKGSIFTFSLPVATEAVVKEAEKYKIQPTGEVKSLEPVAL